MILWLQVLLIRLALGERYNKPRAEDWRAGAAELFLVALTFFVLGRTEVDLPESYWSLFGIMIAFLAVYVVFAAIVSRLPNKVAAIFAVAGIALLPITLLEAYGIL
jgi:hypothetical protein